MSSHPMALLSCICVPLLVLAQEREKPQSPEAAPTTAPALRWCVIGRVTDGDGRPLPGVRITANCGHGTLRGTGTAETGADGRYTLRFGPGMHFLKADEYTCVQAATIFPFKADWFERELNRAGDLCMADRMPTAGELKDYLRTGESAEDFRKRLVLPDQPRDVNFVMVPAVRVEGRVYAPGGAPLEGLSVWLTGTDLPPSSSVAASATSGHRGAFVLTEVPTREYQFGVRPRHGQACQTEAVRFDRPGRWVVELEWDRIDLERCVVRVRSARPVD